MFVNDFGVILDNRDSSITEDLSVYTVEALDLLVLIGDQLRPIEAAFPYRPAITFGVGKIVAEMRGIDKKFLWNAADIDAGAAEVTLFCDRHVGAEPRRHP